MPVQYEGILTEHQAVRQRAGLFDVSHMGELELTGPDAFATLQTLTPNDVGKLTDGRCHYSAFLTETGTFVDDLLVYRRKEDSYMLVVNAGNTPKDFSWARSHAQGQLRLEDKTDAYALIAVQGPLAVRLVARVSDSDPSDLHYYGFRDMKVLGEPALVSRTGYTGEDGFEICVASEAAEKVFRALLEAGRPRVSYRAASVRAIRCAWRRRWPSMATTSTTTVTPWEADLGWIVKMKKGDFIGRDALARQKETGVPRKLVRLRDGRPRVSRAMAIPPRRRRVRASSPPERTRPRWESRSASRCYRPPPRPLGPSSPSTSAGVRLWPASSKPRFTRGRTCRREARRSALHPVPRVGPDQRRDRHDRDHGSRPKGAGRDRLS